MSDKNKKIGLALTSVASILMLLVLIGYMMLIINKFEPIFNATNTTSTIMPTSTTPANVGGHSVNNGGGGATTAKEDLATSSGMKFV